MLSSMRKVAEGPETQLLRQKFQRVTRAVAGVGSHGRHDDDDLSVWRVQPAQSNFAEIVAVKVQPRYFVFAVCPFGDDLYYEPLRKALERGNKTLAYPSTRIRTTIQLRN